MPSIRTDGLVFRRNNFYLFTYPKGRGILQFWGNESGQLQVLRLFNLNTEIDTQFLLMPKSIITSWEKE